MTTQIVGGLYANKWRNIETNPRRLKACPIHKAFANPLGDTFSICTFVLVLCLGAESI